MIGICEICLKTPCDARCPNAELPPIVHYCSECGEPIYDEDEFFYFGKVKYCVNCIDDARSFASKEY